MIQKGARNGQLTAVADSFDNHQRIRVRCDCGVEKTLYASNFKTCLYGLLTQKLCRTASPSLTADPPLNDRDPPYTRTSTTRAALAVTLALAGVLANPSSASAELLPAALRLVVAANVAGIAIRSADTARSVRSDASDIASGSATRFPLQAVVPLFVTTLVRVGDATGATELLVAEAVRLRCGLHATTSREHEQEDSDNRRKYRLFTHLYPLSADGDNRPRTEGINARTVGYGWSLFAENGDSPMPHGTGKLRRVVADLRSQRSDRYTNALAWSTTLGRVSELNICAAAEHRRGGVE